jgi:hypothetical protein
VYEDKIRVSVEAISREGKDRIDLPHEWQALLIMEMNFRVY